jgi:SAM-dependent methyltransferase
MTSWAGSEMAVTRSHLEHLYARTDDPWDFRSSPYEASRFDATLAALPRARYVHALEIGCGNGELARRLVLRCERYTGVDAVAAALAAASKAVPNGTFIQAFLPCDLPEGAYDLIVLSEILYFLDEAGLYDLAKQLDRKWPDAEILAVTWLGPSGNPLEGDAALEHFTAATSRDRLSGTPGDPRHRIDLFLPLGWSDS